jgi:hypothetical protein
MVFENYDIVGGCILILTAVVIYDNNIGGQMGELRVASDPG